jgi:hypothetical protein
MDNTAVSALLTGACISQGQAQSSGGAYASQFQQAAQNLLNSVMTSSFPPVAVNGEGVIEVIWYDRRRDPQQPASSMFPPRSRPKPAFPSTRIKE